MKKALASGYWKRSGYPERKPTRVIPPEPIPQPQPEPENDLTYWIARCMSAEERADKAEKALTAAETRIAELKMDRDILARMRPVSRSVSFTEVF